LRQGSSRKLPTRDLKLNRPATPGHSWAKIDGPREEIRSHQTQDTPFSAGLGSRGPGRTAVVESNRGVGSKRPDEQKQRKGVYSSLLDLTPNFFATQGWRGQLRSLLLRFGFLSARSGLGS